MLENQLVIEKKSNREKILENYKKNEKEWVIDLGNRIKNWDDLYNIIQKEMDFFGYDSAYGKTFETYHEITGEEELFKKMEQEKKEELIILCDYNFKVKEEEKEYIYVSTIVLILLEWYRDLRIIFESSVPYIKKISCKIYFFIDDELFKNNNSFNNRFIIATESDIEKLKKINRNKDFLEIPFINKIENRENFVPDEFEIQKREFEIQKRFKDSLDKINCLEANNTKDKIQVFIKNFDELRFMYRYNLWVYIVENILIKKFIEGQEIDIYAVFEDNIW